MNKQLGKYVLMAYMLLLSTACGNTVFVSSVPSYPVQFELNIYAEYPHFVTGNGFQALTFTQRRFETDYLGYAGLVVWVDMGAEYQAADLCCPHCIKQNTPLELDGFYAVCPICGEEYDLSFGIANPTKGISNETLRKYTTMYGNGKLRIAP